MARGTGCPREWRRESSSSLCSEAPYLTTARRLLLGVPGDAWKLMLEGVAAQSSSSCRGGRLEVEVRREWRQLLLAIPRGAIGSRGQLGCATAPPRRSLGAIGSIGSRGPCARLLLAVSGLPDPMEPRGALSMRDVLA
jgi:hypothetical protein